MKKHKKNKKIKKSLNSVDKNSRIYYIYKRQ